MIALKNLFICIRDHSFQNIDISKRIDNHSIPSQKRLITQQLFIASINKINIFAKMSNHYSQRIYSSKINFIIRNKYIPILSWTKKMMYVSNIVNMSHRRRRIIISRSVLMIGRIMRKSFNNRSEKIVVKKKLFS